MEFIKTVDGIFEELLAQGELRPGIQPQVLRSALMGAIEGMLRDHMLSRTSRFPAAFTEADIRAMVSTLVSVAMRQ